MFIAIQHQKVVGVLFQAAPGKLPLLLNEIYHFLL
jgi:hypothetical protein